MTSAAAPRLDPAASPAFTAPAAPASAAGTRLLGVLGMTGAPAFLGISQHVTQGELGPQLLMLAYVVGWLCSAVGLRRLRAAGNGRGARILTGVQLAGLTLAGLQIVQDIAGQRPLGSIFYTITDVAWPVSHLFMLVVFAAVWRARVWTGWRRWTPLAGGLVIPLTLLMAAAKVVDPGAMFNVGTALSFLAFGLAVATAAPEARTA